MQQQVTIAQAIELALQHHRAERLEDAENIYCQILSQTPNYPDALHLLGVLASQRGRYDAAIDLIQRAISLQPGTVEYHSNIAGILRMAGKRDEALAHFRRSMQINPNLLGLQALYGLTLSEAGFLDEAMEVLVNAARLEPQRGGIYLDMGNIYWKKMQHEEARQCFLKAIECEPDNPGNHWSCARVSLQLGLFKEGLEEFEWRLKFKEMKLDRGFAQPQWDGSDATGKTILLHAEGGLGDALHFMRLVPMAVKRGGKFIVECQPALIPLFQQIEGVDRIIPRGQPLPAFDAHLPLQGLMRILGITLQAIPNQVPYLRAPEERVQAFAARIPNDSKLRVGLVWCGVQYNEADFRTRSLDIFHDILKLPGIRFFSLQKGEAASQKPPEGVDWIDFAAELNDYADTAALIQNLDLLISVDTSAAHAAGALAKPVWVLVPTQSDFRWLLDRSDSPWYPTMRLFRQQLGGDWSKALHDIRQSLAGFPRKD